MPLVHDAVKTLNGRTRTTPQVIAGLCCLAVIAGCGSSGHASTRISSAGREPVSLATCSDWKNAATAERRKKIVELREFAGGPVGSSEGIQHGPVIDDGRAYKLFQGYCSNFFARGFKLYKLYTHAAAFIGH